MRAAWSIPIIITLDPHPLHSSELRARFRQRQGQTILTDKYHTAPIKIAKTFPLEEQLAAIVMDVSPGLLSGDHYTFDWQAEADTRLYLTNQSYTKVHPCPPEGRASMRHSFALGPGALVESMMEPLMLYRDAALRNDTEVRLSPGSVWMQIEVLCPGRTHRGETFRYRLLDNRLRVYYGEELIFAQRQRVEPDRHDLRAPGAWEDMTHTGTFYVFADRIAPSHAEAVREALEQLPLRDGELVCGVSLTHRHGLAVLAAGRAAWQLQEALELAWRTVRRELLALPPLQFRK
ncbi:urease accessory protein [Paenibacillus sp. 598K]|uniref:urease accessory protein UreD n=1 Tax=Paenibacillus sp. 598K TaxID=1117987 RepID=UPI000FFA9C61|nr:urease accessory protein UreD [Paenibacillus sp. 598K]GBF76625.1 urease accessory protein [Paenibacillus sp. 598K]